LLLNISPLRELNIASMLLRIFLAMLAGGILGFERERKRRPAGFRTYMLVSLGAALTMLLGQYMDLMLKTQWQTPHDHPWMEGMYGALLEKTVKA